MPFDSIKLHRLIGERKWDEVIRILGKVSKRKLKSSAINDPIVYFACEFCAPLAVIVKLSSMFPASLDTADSSERYPISYAVASGCLREVIRFLVRTNAQAVA